MLMETVLKYYDKKYDLNCAECILVAANEEYDLNIQGDIEDEDNNKWENYNSK